MINIKSHHLKVDKKKKSLISATTHFTLKKHMKFKKNLKFSKIYHKALITHKVPKPKYHIGFVEWKSPKLFYKLIYMSL